MAEAIPISIQRLPHSDGIDLPSYESAGAAGMDLRAAIAEPITLAPMQREAVPTGLQIAIPQGYEAQVRPRSGLAFKHGLTVANAPGTIDSDYRGEVKVLLINLGDQAVEIERGMRIAQMVVAPVTLATWAEVDRLDATARGSGGFGSTGQ
ncbi:MAG: dUTP diphosphatase [Alphaproteobacteria bacterium]|nr:dUTP diphosphatase [Alphaproteobacteria bacterium]